ncbi:glycosyltransferase family 2 protein [Paraburkholderia adhaesiva]|uniref:glycosyltransferase family 2 protein n=1 Tax=Paraburkholderia adhaesiva TaxID=2883244 RepID=UPI001F3E9101|nr:glycosyltransferase family 2 protein [Paraburkholderia adhaesiva]
MKNAPIGDTAAGTPAAKKPLISLIAPFYNECEAVDRFFEEVQHVLDSVDAIRYEIVCINDGSRDGTLEKLVAMSERDRRIKVIDFTRNFGKEAALTAGLDEANGDAVIAIDADLQDPPSLIPEMIERWQAGAEVVLARRANRACDSVLKRTTAALFYRVHNALSEVKIPENVGDFRLMDRQVVNALRSLPERHRFMKGLFAWVGFNAVTIDYERTPRSAGKTKFSGWRLWNFALEGITSFSTVPLRSWTYIGGAIALLAFCYGGVIVGRTVLFGNPVPGYASLISVVLFIGGMQLAGIGVIGEYVGRIYDESKERPVYLVRRRYEARAKVSTLPVERADARSDGPALELVRKRVTSRLRATAR